MGLADAVVAVGGGAEAHVATIRYGQDCLGQDGSICMQMGPQRLLVGFSVGLGLIRQAWSRSKQYGAMMAAALSPQMDCCTRPATGQPWGTVADLMP